MLPTEELAFFDIIEYNPSLLQSPPYALRVRSVVPFVGDRVSTLGAICVLLGQLGSADGSLSQQCRVQLCCKQLYVRLAAEQLAALHQYGAA